jgi:tetratricopeptide (TPR) repeat protein
MKEAGFDNGLDVPLTLKRDIADQANRDYFIDGTIERSEQQYLVTARVWKTASLEQLHEISAMGWDLMQVVDEVSTGIRELLDTPPGMGDLPLGETFGESEDALRSYLDARNAVLFENDREKANRFYNQALHADPGFVLAWFMKSLSLWEQGNVTGAQRALEETQKLSYRLPERDQVTAKLMAYRISGEQDKVEALLRMQTQIVGDATSHQRLAMYLELAGELEEAKEQFRRQMEVDSKAIEVLLHLARLERSTGDIDAAIAHAQRYVEREAEDPTPLILLGQLFVEAGDMDQARSWFERAQIIEEPAMSSTLSLAMLSIRQGEWVQARELIAESRDMAASARHVITVLQVESYLEQRLGRIGQSLALTEEQLPFIQQALAPVDQLFTYNFPVIKFNVVLDRLDEAENALLLAKQALQSPMEQLFAFSEVTVDARKGDLDGAAAALEAGMQFIDHFKADFMAFMVPRAKAEIAEARGDYSAAGRFYRETIEQVRRSVIASGSQAGQSELYGACAQAHVRAGELEVAQSVLNHAFKRDGAEPKLWVARAMLQEANGAPQMALASINYALAIWAEADPDYVDYREALDLRQRLEAAPD